MTPQPVAYLALVPAFPLLGALLNGVFGARLRHGTVHVIAVGAMFASFVVAVIALGDAIGLRASGAVPSQQLYMWFSVGALDVKVGLLADPLSVVMMLVITGVGLLIHLFSVGYMHADAAYARYFAYLNLFVFFMLMLVMADNLVLMFLGWEGVGLCSYLLIGFWYDDEAKARAGEKAFIVNRIGDFGFLVGIFTVAWQMGALDFAGMRAHMGGLAEPWALAIALALFVGAMGKSAQVPLYVWLPDAMAGPTPVSALIHAATMVTAGVYMVTRLHFVYEAAPWAMVFVAAIGAFTAFFAATIGLVQRDIKKVLAYSTVSQLGYMFLGAGVGAFGAAIAHLVTHAFFKACLFLGSGSVIHAMQGEQDVLAMGGLKRHMKWTYLTFTIATLAIMGFPLTSGFFSKDAILTGAFAGALHGPFTAPMRAVLWLSWALALVTVGMTAFYMWRLNYLTFAGDERMDPRAREHLHESPHVMTIPLIILAALSVIGWVSLPFGASLVDWWLAPVLKAGAGAGAGASDHAHLAVGLEIGLMVLSVAVAFAGWGVARKLYGDGRLEAATRLKVRFDAMYKVLYNKWFVDETYQATFVRGLFALSDRTFRWIDRVIIDGLLVDGLAAAVPRLIGEAGRYLQNGDTGRYAFAMAVGLAVVLFAFLGGP